MKRAARPTLQLVDGHRLPDSVESEYPTELRTARPAIHPAAEAAGLVAGLRVRVRSLEADAVRVGRASASVELRDLDPTPETDLADDMAGVTAALARLDVLIARLHELAP